MPSSTISSKGQITLPVEVRRRLGVKAGDRVDFVVENDRTIILPGRTEENPFEQFKGAFPHFNSLEEINAWIHEMRGHDPEDQDL